VDHVTRPHPFEGWSVVRKLTLDIARKHTKFHDASISRSEYILWGARKIQKVVT